MSPRIERGTARSGLQVASKTLADALLFVGRRVVHLAEGAGVELPSHLHRKVVPNPGVAVAALAHERDGLRHDVARGQQVGEPLAAVRFEDLVHALMILVVLADVGGRGSPCRGRSLVGAAVEAAVVLLEVPDIHGLVQPATQKNSRAPGSLGPWPQDMAKVLCPLMLPPSLGRFERDATAPDCRSLPRGCRSRYTTSMGKRAAKAQSLIEKIQSLPPDKVAVVEDFVDFLGQRDNRRLTQAATKLSEKAFAKVWDNPDDALYDHP
jgi:hypothetical protein